MAFIFSNPLFYTKFVHQPTANDLVSRYIQNNPKLQPFLIGGIVIGAIDGSHIHAWAPGARRPAFRNREGYLSQNCLCCCSFDLLFTYTLTGWERSASDAQIYHNAVEKQDHKIPESCWLLSIGRCRFPSLQAIASTILGCALLFGRMGTCTIAVVSQFSTNIHHTNYLIRLVNKEELFDLWHAQARNVVERIFGVLKRQFRILLICPEYDPKIQARIVSALCATHNFICIHNPKEGELAESRDSEHANRGSNAGDEVVTQLEGFDATKSEDVVHRCDLIAKAMCDSY